MIFTCRSKLGSPVATIIGDVVRSRDASDRTALHTRLAGLVEEANAVLAPAVPLRITVGDEFQGCFATVGEALHATLWLGLQLAPQAELRHGVAWGSVAVLADEPRVEDGPGWWAARDAIELVELEAAGPPPGTGARPTSGSTRRAAGTDRTRVRSTRRCSVGTRWLGLCRHGRCGCCVAPSQAGPRLQLAADEGISPSAVSQRVRHDGLAVIVAADELLRRTT